MKVLFHIFFNGLLAGLSFFAIAPFASAADAPPTVSLSVSPTSAFGQTASLKWSSTNATSCTASGGWSGTKATSGTIASAPVTAATNFILVCIGPGGRGAAAALTTIAPQKSYTYTNDPSHRTMDFWSTLGVGLDLGSTPERNNINFVADDVGYIGFKFGRVTIGSVSSDKAFISKNWVMPVNAKVSAAGVAGSTQITSAQLVQTFAAVGLRFDPVFYLKDPIQYQNWLDTNASYLAAIEGPNEVDLSKNKPPAEPFGPNNTYNGLNLIPGGVALQKAIWKMVKSDPQLKNLPVYNLAIGEADPSMANVGDLAPYADYNNVHPYPEYEVAPFQILAAIIQETTQAPEKPFVATEIGYWTKSLTAPGGGGNMVSETVQSKYTLDAVFDTYNLGYVKTYIYELIDQLCDTVGNNPQSHYGMFRCDNTPKPLAVGFHNLYTILKDTSAGATSFKPAPLTYTLQQSLATMSEFGKQKWQLGPSSIAGIQPYDDVGQFHTLLQKQNGTYELVLWSEPTLYDHKTKSDVASESIPVNSVTLTLSKTYSTIKVYDPLQSTDPIQQTDNTKQVTVKITDHPIVVEIIAKPDMPAAKK